MEKEKLVGLRAYQKEEAKFFYGREKEVEGLLQILDPRINVFVIEPDTSLFKSVIADCKRPMPTSVFHNF